MDPPQDVTPQSTLFSIIFAIVAAVFLMLILMKYKAETFFRIWFFIVVTLALGITFNSMIINTSNSATIALIIALPLAFIKVFKRNLILHNLTELLVYPGIAAIFYTTPTASRSYVVCNGVFDIEVAKVRIPGGAWDGVCNFNVWD